jgi:dienelactone hydrolase
MKRGMVITLMVILGVSAWGSASGQEAEPAADRSGIGSGPDRVEALLAEVDPWIATDEDRVAAFIERHNKLTEDRITSMPKWASIHADLGDVLGIDLLGGPAVDNTGRIYFMMRITGEETALFYVDEPGSWPVQVTPNGWAEKGLQIGRVKLDPDGDYLYLQVMKQLDENWDIYRFERDGTYRPVLVDRSLAFSSVFPDGDDAFICHIMDLARGKFWLARYDFATASLDTLHTEPMPFGNLDYYDGKVLCIRMKSGSELQLFEYEVATATTKDLTDFHEIHSADYTEDGRVIAVSDARSSEDEFVKVVVFDPDEAPVDQEDMKIFYDPGVEIDGVLLGRESELVCVRLNRDGYNNLVVLTMDGQATDLPSPGIGIIANAAMNDLGDLAFDFNSPSVVPTAYYLPRGGTEPEQIGSISTFGHDFSRVGVEVIRYPSTDGTMIPALFYVPEGAARDGSNPCIVNYHGGPMAQSVPVFQRNIAFALSRGVIFLFPNVRGSTGYGPAWERADNLEGRFQALKDAEAALDYLVEEGWSSPEKIAIWGASYGGYTVDYLAVHAPEKFACGISEVGVSDLDWTLEHGNPGFIETHEDEYGKMGSELARKLSPIYHAGAVERPLFLTAGSNDPRVPPSDPRRFAWLLERLGKDVLFFEETESGHGVSGRSQVIHDLARAYTFMFHHIME